MFVRDAWYVGALSQELAVPVGRRLLGERVALFRTGSGRAAALADRCAHRAAPLSAGVVVDETLRCPYHGYRFGADGGCVAIPGQEHVPAAADEALIPDFSSNCKPGWAGVSMHMRAAAGYELLVENLLDLSHVAFVHGGTIGSDDTGARLSLERGEDFVRSIRSSHDIPTPPHNIAQGFAPRCDQTKVMHFTPPSRVTLEITTTERPERSGAPSRSMHLLLHNAMTPETATSCHYFWASTRDFQVDDTTVSEFFRTVTRTAFEEDLAILALQQENLEAEPAAAMVSTGNDAAAVAARRMIAQMRG